MMCKNKDDDEDDELWGVKRRRIIFFVCVKRQSVTTFWFATVRFMITVSSNQTFWGMIYDMIRGGHQYFSKKH
jgi:hypothetical protein